jgi:hypothetical protein
MLMYWPLRIWKVQRTEYIDPQMQGMGNFKIIDVQQAEMINNSKNAKQIT